MKFVGNRINNIHLRDLVPHISKELEIDFFLAEIACFCSAPANIEFNLGN